jgi:hypothetical protein
MCNMGNPLIGHHPIARKRICDKNITLSTHLHSGRTGKTSTSMLTKKGLRGRETHKNGFVSLAYYNWGVWILRIR